MGLRILCEGADAAGKSTLIENLQKSIGGIHLHHGRLSDDVITCIPDKIKSSFFKYHTKMRFDETFELMKQFKNSKENLIIDRMFISDMIYSKHFRKGTFLSSHDIDKYLTEIDILILCCPKDLEFQIQEFKRVQSLRFELFDNIKDIIENFYQLSKSWKFTDSNKNSILNYYDFSNHNQYKRIVYDWTIDLDASQLVNNLEP